MQSHHVFRAERTVERELGRAAFLVRPFDDRRPSRALSATDRSATEDDGSRSCLAASVATRLLVVTSLRPPFPTFRRGTHSTQDSTHEHLCVVGSLSPGSAVDVHYARVCHGFASQLLSPARPAASAARSRRTRGTATGPRAGTRESARSRIPRAQSSGPPFPQVG